MATTTPTRGHGLLEAFLARQRARKADQLIPPALREGSILDIGCGSYPTFLKATRFERKFGLDRVLSSATIARLGAEGICLQSFDADRDDRLPFEDESLSVVTMLAVYEHLAEPRLRLVLSEVRRVLEPNGVFLMTTPAHWTDPLLTVLASVGLISHEELDEHKRSHRHEDIKPLLEQAGFGSAGLRMGYFELGMNLWARAEKQPSTTASPLWYAPSVGDVRQGLSASAGDSRH